MTIRYENTNMKNLIGLPTSVFSSREERNAFVADHYKKIISGSLLNIGDGGNGHLKKFIPSSVRYTGIDIAGNPDILINLETEIPLPFEDKSFDLVVCTDVLEHLDNLHQVFAELCRIAKSHIIISLPNAWVQNLDNILKSNYTSAKYYGLPQHKPIDRHKWHFSFSEAYTFINTISPEYGFKNQEMLSIGYNHRKSRKQFKRIIIQTLFGKEARHNLFSTTLFVHLQRCNN